MKLLIVTGSARPTSVNQHVVKAVEKLASEREGVEMQIADLAALDLPFVNSEVEPSSPNFEITDERVQRWSDMVNANDAVLFVLPEYNHGMSALSKNALDWLFKEWNDKPVSGVAYSWHNAKFTAAAFDGALGVVKAKVVEPITQLQFKEVVELDGSIIDQEAFDERVNTTLNQLIAATK